MPGLLQAPIVVSACDVYYEILPDVTFPLVHLPLACWHAGQASLLRLRINPKGLCPPGLHPMAPRLTWARQKDSARTIRPWHRLQGTDMARSERVSFLFKFQQSVHVLVSTPPPGEGLSSARREPTLFGGCVTLPYHCNAA